MIRPYSPLTNGLTSVTIERLKGRYRGVEQLVARRAHNPEVVRFKSHPRNQGYYNLSNPDNIGVIGVVQFLRLSKIGYICLRN